MAKVIIGGQPIEVPVMRFRMLVPAKKALEAYRADADTDAGFEHLVRVVEIAADTAPGTLRDQLLVPEMAGLAIAVMEIFEEAGMRAVPASGEAQPPATAAEPSPTEASAS